MHEKRIDIGRGNGELLVRAYQISFLAPFCRNHKVIDGYDQEPWRFGKYYEDIIRKYLKLRSRTRRAAWITATVKRACWAVG